MEPKPTVGRCVHYFNSGSTEPLAATATVAKVWSDECINVGFLDVNGVANNATSVPKGDPADTSRCRWAWPTRS